jgi:hypothetical protein
VLVRFDIRIFENCRGAYRGVIADNNGFYTAKADKTKGDQHCRCRHYKKNEKSSEKNFFRSRFKSFLFHDVLSVRRNRAAGAVFEFSAYTEQGPYMRKRINLFSVIF